MRELFDQWVDAHRDAIVSATQDVLRIPSVLDADTAGPDAPFGRAVADALDHTLSLCGTLGFETENFGGFAGHATYGAGTEIAAMLGHLDVVPPGKDWTVDPWGATVKDGFLWGRGTSDDKGPTFAALWGAKAVIDVCQAENITLSRQLRLIFGCDEESQWRCMAHYFGAAGQPMPTVAFTPDADFPLVHAEKGSYTAIAEKSVSSEGGSMRVASFTSGLRANMVPDEATALLVGDQGALELAAHVLAEAPGITVRLDESGLHVTAKGVSAHGATPQAGDNAAVKLMRALTANGSAFDDLAGADFQWMNDLARRAAPDGSTVGIGGSDDVTGPLTCNLGVVRLIDGVAKATFNVRYPATWDGEETIEKMRASLAETGWALDFSEGKFTPPLYVPTDQEPVKTLLRVYREHTGDMRPPLTMGGRTYATSVAPVGVAYGAAMPGDPETAHQADERFGVERLIQCAKIYAHALYEMAK